jgi:hypothetical protein
VPAASHRIQIWPAPLLCAAVSAAAAGCAPPNQANVLLRRQSQQLQSVVEQVNRENDGLTAQIQAEESRPGATTQQLPESQLAKLFTTHGVTIVAGTGGYSDDPNGPDQVLKVFVCPTDETGEKIKAAGSFKVEMFDLDEKDTRLGTCEFTTEQARNDWVNVLAIRCYVLTCPWQERPRHASIHLKVTFTDELTGRQFSDESDVKVRING